MSTTDTTRRSPLFPFITMSIGLLTIVWVTSQNIKFAENSHPATAQDTAMVKYMEGEVSESSIQPHGCFVRVNYQTLFLDLTEFTGECKKNETVTIEYERIERPWYILSIPEGDHWMARRRVLLDSCPLKGTI